MLQGKIERKRMSLAAALAAVLLYAASLSVAAAPAKAYTGQIMDSMCAAMGGHSAGYAMTHTHTPKACTLACVKMGSTFVLYNAASKTTYKLDNQKAPRAFAGENVKVEGDLNPATGTIHVIRILPGK